VGVNVNGNKAEKETVVVEVVVNAKGNREGSGRRLYVDRRTGPEDQLWKKKIMSVVGAVANEVRRKEDRKPREKWNGKKIEGAP
jgi:hypothetical protein